MLLSHLQQRRKDIARLGNQFGARHIRVFGSVARGDSRADSDVDFLVDFPVGYDLLKQRIALTQALQQLLGCQVDVVPEHELSPYIREQVLGEAVDL